MSETLNAQDLQLKKGSPAPYNGVFMDEFSYRELLEREANYNDTLGDYLECKYECDQKINEIETNTWMDSAVWFVFGSLAGALVMSSGD